MEYHDNELINILYSQLQARDQLIVKLRSQLEEALEANEELQEPAIDSFYDL